MQHLFPAIVYLNLKAELTHTPFFFFLVRRWAVHREGCWVTKVGAAAAGGRERGNRDSCCVPLLSASGRYCFI